MIIFLMKAEIIGNKDMIATFSDKGELLRLLYPNRDFKQSCFTCGK